MPTEADPLTPLVPAGEHLSPLFVGLLLVHIAAGLVSVVSGAGAAASRKRRGRHPRFGTVYYAGLLVVFLTTVGMGTLRWAQDSYLVALGTLSFATASLGYVARKIRWKNWTRYHIVGMGLSYIVLLTAFYVDNGARLPVWDHLPPITYWLLPSLVGIPLIVRAWRRHTPRTPTQQSTDAAKSRWAS